MKVSKALILVGMGAAAGIIYAACKGLGKKIEVRLVPNERCKENLMVKSCAPSGDECDCDVSTNKDFSFQDTDSYDAQVNADDFSASSASEAFTTTEGESEI